MKDFRYLWILFGKILNTVLWQKLAHIIHLNVQQFNFGHIYLVSDFMAIDLQNAKSMVDDEPTHLPFSQLTLNVLLPFAMNDRSKLTFSFLVFLYKQTIIRAASLPFFMNS